MRRDRRRAAAQSFVDDAPEVAGVVDDAPEDDEPDDEDDDDEEDDEEDDEDESPEAPPAPEPDAPDPELEVSADRESVR